LAWSLVNAFSIISESRRALPAIISANFFELFMVCPMWLQKSFIKLVKAAKLLGNGTIVPFRISAIAIFVIKIPSRYKWKSK
jgi:hypothetical protein